MLEGLIPVLLTPMKNDFSVDQDGLNNLIDYLDNHRVKGLWALGSASEEINIGFEKKVQVARLINDACQESQMKVIMGSGNVSLDDHYRFIERTADCNFDGLHVLPYDLKMGVSRTINLFEKIAERSPWPVWLYHNPKRGRSFEISTVQELSEHENIGGIKIGGYNLTEITKCFMLRNSNFDVIAAGSGQIFSCLSLGAKAHTTSEGCVYPSVFQKIISLYEDDKKEKALFLQNEWLKLNSRIKRTSNGEHCAEEKYFLSLMGICEEWVNENYETYPKIWRSELESIHEEIMKLCEF